MAGVALSGTRSVCEYVLIVCVTGAHIRGGLLLNPTLGRRGQRGEGHPGSRGGVFGGPRPALACATSRLFVPLSLRLRV